MPIPCLDTSFTSDQATDLAKYFLGPEWFAWTMNGACVLGRPKNGASHADTSWRAVFRQAGVKLPVRAQYASIGKRVMFGGECVASCVSGSVADLLAQAANLHGGGRRHRMR